jgi:hypothetical protein
MTMRRERLLGAIVVVATLIVVLGLAEAGLRFLPVPTGFRTLSVTAESPVLHFTPNRDFVFSRDWDMAMVNRGHVNNAGFVNNQDYHERDALPLLAVIGDSYIEAAMVPYAETMHGRLASALFAKWRVYSLGASGAPLSQYLVWAKHVVQTYGAQALVINVVGNDFDESHSAYRTAPGFWHYVPDEKGTLRLQLFEYRPSVLRKIVHASALARYLVFNLQLARQWENLRSVIFGGPAMAQPQYAGNTAFDASPVRVSDSLAVIDAFFRDIPEMTGMPPSRILFVVEGMRYPDAAAAAKGSYFDLMRRTFLQKAHSLGYDALDLDPPFFEHHRRTGERFDFPRDGHWSSIGHGVAFKAVAESPFMARLADARAGSQGDLGPHGLGIAPLVK